MPVTITLTSTRTTSCNYYYNDDDNYYDCKDYYEHGDVEACLCLGVFFWVMTLELYKRDFRAD